MSPRDIAFVGCRLLALYVFLLVVQAQISNVFFYLPTLTVSETGNVQSDYFSRYFGASLTNLVVCIALWFGAGWLSGKVAAGTTDTQGKESAAWSPQSALSIVVIATGLLVLISLVPSLTFVLQQVVQRGFLEPIPVISVVLTIVVGLLCILSPRAIAGFIARFRGW